MRVNEKHTLGYDRQTVWDMLNDPAVLEAAIPGADKLIEESPDHYRAELSVGIGMIRGAFGGTVEVADKVEPESYRMLVDGTGPGGWVKGDVLITLDEAGPSSTDVTIDGDATVGGLLARVGQRMMTNATRSLMRQFFSRLDAEIGRRTAG